MTEFLNIVFWFAAGFLVVDYILGRATVKDPVRAIVATLFAVLYVIFVHSLF